MVWKIAEFDFHGLELFAGQGKTTTPMRGRAREAARFRRDFAWRGGAGSCRIGRVMDNEETVKQLRVALPGGGVRLFGRNLPAAPV